MSNIYLDRLDQYVEQRLIPEYNRGRRRRPNPAYQTEQTDRAAQKHRDRRAARTLGLRRRPLPS